MADKKKLTDFIPQKQNPNRHNTFGMRLLEKSLQTDGWIGAQTAAADGEIIAGSARQEIAAEKFIDENGEAVEPIVIHTSGDRPVIIVRDDIPNAETARARRLSTAENAIANANYNPDFELLKSWAGEDEQIKKMFSDDEWREGTGEGGADNNYSRKIEVPIYTPKGDKPALSDLFDEARAKELIAEIDAAELPEDEKEFLRIAARRHTVLNFKRIAEYYAHSAAPVQRLMENSALVIIDFKRAIELGYVKLSEEIAKQYLKDYPDAR